MEDEAHKLDKKKVKKLGLGFYFALTTSLLIAAAIIFTAFYSMNCITLVVKDYKETAQNYKNMIPYFFMNTFNRSYNSKNYTDANDAANFLIESNFVQYIYVYNRGGKIFWSSNPEYLNKDEEEFQDSVLPYVNQENDVEKFIYNAPYYSFCFGLMKNKIQASDYQNMFDNLRLFVILFLLAGVCISAFICALVTKPVHALVTGVQAFGSGNFEHKIENTGFEEIDTLVDTYNSMSQKLSELYGSLEAKVEERTKELETANQKLKETQTMMVHSEKMRSLGELVAGIAHEINNPVNFVYGNIMILDNYRKDLIELIEKYTALLSKTNTEGLNEIEAYKQEIDYDFLKEDIKDLIKSCIEGVERTKNIVADLKNFSRMEEMVFSECSIPKEIDTTLNILNNKIKGRIQIHRDYEENLPKIEAYVGQINQVFMNILDNAQGAIKENGSIYIKVKKEGENVVISFEDTGCGIEEKNINKIFEPFFTTKAPGKGTGLGMAITYKVIEAHHGKIAVNSVVGKGTKITLTLPIEQKIEEQSVVATGANLPNE